MRTAIIIAAIIISDAIRNDTDLSTLYEENVLALLGWLLFVFAVADIIDLIK